MGWRPRLPATWFSPVLHRARILDGYIRYLNGLPTGVWIFQSRGNPGIYEVCYTMILEKTILKVGRYMLAILFISLLWKRVWLFLNKLSLTSERYENVYAKTTWRFHIKSIFQIWSKLIKVSNINRFSSNYWCCLCVT